MSSGPSDELSLEQQVALLKQKLAEAQRLTAMGELSSTITHEFNNVLMTVINYAKMGLRHTDNETRQRAFEKILTAGNRAARITHSILGMARNRSNNLEPTDLVRLVEDTLLLLERELSKYRVTVERKFADVPLIRANGNQIQQVLLNLLINARQAMPHGGRIYLSIQPEAQNKTVELTVRDTGTGMTPETLRRIFDPFFSTKQGPDASGKGGTGLGLATCRDIMEAHGGRIRVESAPGKGTAFTLKLPIAGGDTATPTTALSPPLEGPANTPTPDSHA